MATSRTEMERKLRCNKVEGLSKDFQRVAENMAVKYVQKYSIKDSGYELSYDLVKNRIENLMLDALAENPSLSPGEFATRTRLTEIFIDIEDILYLVELAGEADSDEFFYYAYHFFALSVFSYINHHSFYVNSLDRHELLSVLYTQVYFALKGCAQKNVYFNFNTLYLMYRAAVFELIGVFRMPFTMHRRDVEQYLRFRATVTNCNYGLQDLEKVTKLLSLSRSKAISYWEIYINERNGFLSTSQIMEDENLENIFGKAEETGFSDAEIMEMRNRLFESEEDRHIFDSLIGNGDGVFSREEIESLGTTRYRINLVKEKIRQKEFGLKPLK